MARSNSRIKSRILQCVNCGADYHPCNHGQNTNYCSVKCREEGKTKTDKLDEEPIYDRNGIIIPAYEVEEIRNEINKLKEKLATIKGPYGQLQCLEVIRVNMETIQDRRLYKCCELMAKIGFQSGSKLKENEKGIAGLWIQNAYGTLARLGSFYYFVRLMESSFPLEQKFLEPRIGTIRPWLDSLQDLKDDNLDILGISAPPRTGKTGIGELFFLYMGAMYPQESCFFATHTNAMAKKVYEDIERYIRDPRRCFEKAFPDLKITASNKEELWIQLGEQVGYHTFYFRGIDSNMAGVVEASKLLYCDDLIVNLEEAQNPSRLETVWGKFTTDIRQRRKHDRVKELHIATRWSLYDPQSRMEEMNEGSPKAKFIKVPGLRDDGESNFNYTVNPMTKEHFLNLKEGMDDVSFAAIVQQEPIEREGLLIKADDLNYYYDLPEGKPDMICMSNDISWGGGDYYSGPIGYVYGYDVYIEDVVYDNGNKDTTRPLVMNKIRYHNVTRINFEGNNGGTEYAEYIRDEMRREGLRPLITEKKAPTTKTKLNRILACVPEMKGTLGENRGYRIFFKHKSIYQKIPEYSSFMKHMFRFNQSWKYQGKQIDDGIDSIAQLITDVLGVKVGEVSTYSRNSLF